MHNMEITTSVIDDFKEKLSTVRNRLLKMHYDAHVGHLGPSLSALDIMMTLFHLVKEPRDRFILSKGHAASALYATLWSLRLLNDEDLSTFCQDGSRLPAHPHGDLPSIMFPTGSLGHGFALACGLTIAARRSPHPHHVWCLCGDGEWQEGECWESLIFAVHHRLDNLTLLVDCNGLQGIGTTEEVASMQNLTSHFAGFGVLPQTVDGHSPEALLAAMRTQPHGLPRVLLCKTIKGHGLQSAGKVSSHYLPLSDQEYGKLMAGESSITTKPQDEARHA